MVLFLDVPMSVALHTKCPVTVSIWNYFLLLKQTSDSICCIWIIHFYTSVKSKKKVSLDVINFNIYSTYTYNILFSYFNKIERGYQPGRREVRCFALLLLRIRYSEVQRYPLPGDTGDYHNGGKGGPGIPAFTHDTEAITIASDLERTATNGCIKTVGWKLIPPDKRGNDPSSKRGYVKRWINEV